MFWSLEETYIPCNWVCPECSHVLLGWCEGCGWNVFAYSVEACLLKVYTLCHKLHWWNNGEGFWLLWKFLRLPFGLGFCCLLCVTGVKSLEPDNWNKRQQKQSSTPKAPGIPRKCGQKEFRSQEGGAESWEMLPSGYNRTDAHSSSQHQVSQQSNMGRGAASKTLALAEELLTVNRERATFLWGCS